MGNAPLPDQTYLLKDLPAAIANPVQAHRPHTVKQTKKCLHAPLGPNIAPAFPSLRIKINRSADWLREMGLACQSKSQRTVMSG